MEYRRTPSWTFTSAATASLRTPSWTTIMAATAAADADSSSSGSSSHDEEMAAHERLRDTFGVNVLESLALTFTLASAPTFASSSSSSSSSGIAVVVPEADHAGARRALSSIGKLLAHRRNSSKDNGMGDRLAPLNPTAPTSDRFSGTATFLAAHAEISSLLERVSAAAMGAYGEPQLATELDDAYARFGQENKPSFAQLVNLLADEPPLSPMPGVVSATPTLSPPSNPGSGVARRVAVAAAPAASALTATTLHDPTLNDRRRRRSSDELFGGATFAAGLGAGAAADVPDITDTPLSGDDAAQWSRYDWVFGGPTPAPPSATAATTFTPTNRRTLTAEAPRTWMPPTLQAASAHGGEPKLPPRIHPDWVLHELPRLQKILALRALYLEQAAAIRARFTTDLELRDRLIAVPSFASKAGFAVARSEMAGRADHHVRQRLGTLHDTLLDALHMLLHPRQRVAVAADTSAFSISARYLYGGSRSDLNEAQAAGSGVDIGNDTEAGGLSNAGVGPRTAGRVLAPSTLPTASSPTSSASSASSSSSSSSARRFDRDTVAALETYFRNDPYPNDAVRHCIARTLQLTHKQVINWFTNKRMRTHYRNEHQ